MFPANRQQALQRLQNFIPASGKYSRDRNHVYPFEHGNVSRLSAAIRHRLVSEAEVAAAPLERYAPSTVEKFTQEVYWRRYWKSWLSLRPQVWSQYREELTRLTECPDPAITARIETIARQESGLAIMDLFTRELVETGYLHNHARMWWAGWWIHVERLPWQLGADFFYRHLLDADAASNTLSWRWVAGLQTKGKSYLPRRSNLAKYLPPELISTHSSGLELLEKPTAWRPESFGEVAKITRESLPGTAPSPDERTLLWIHEDDLTPEYASELPRDPTAFFVTADEATWDSEEFSPRKRVWTRSALQDSFARARAAYPDAVSPPEVKPFCPREVAQFCRTHEITQIISLRPEVGLIHDQIPSLCEAWQEEGIELHLVDRAEDLALRPLATAGFFSYWKKVQRAQSRKSQ